MTTLTKRDNFSLTPSNLNEAMQLADIMAKSSIVPKNYQGKPGDILVAVQMGADLGLKPMQALQSIAVVNGRPSIFGDSLLALVQAHPSFEDIHEYFDEKLQAAVCIVKRKNQAEHTSVFSINDAKKAGLWAKPGPWSSYPKRMLQMRARGFALRDKFADALGGLILAEEASDYPTRTVNHETQDVASKTASMRSKLDAILKKAPQETAEEFEAETHETHEVIDATYEEQNENQPEQDLLTGTERDRLYALVVTHDIPNLVIDKWLEKAGVSKLDELDDEKVLSCIAYIEEKYNK